MIIIAEPNFNTSSLLYKQPQEYGEELRQNQKVDASSDESRGIYKQDPMRFRMRLERS